MVRPHTDHRKWNNRLNGPHWTMQLTPHFQLVICGQSVDIFYGFNLLIKGRWPKFLKFFINFTSASSLSGESLFREQN